jgi:hypothetical protein
MPHFPNSLPAFQRAAASAVLAKACASENAANALNSMQEGGR